MAIQVLLYTNNEYTAIECDIHDTAESVCQKLCQQLSIRPACCLLFSLRISETSDFIPGCQKIETKTKYDFRLRFQMLQRSTLKRIDKNAYNYFYHQVKCDLINGKIPELAYPNYKDKVAGLCVTNMYIEMLENNVSISHFESNYKKYIPEKYWKKHSFIIRQRIASALSSIKNLQHDSYYVKGTFLETIQSLAPNYLVERCTGLAPYLPEDDLNEGTCTVDLEFLPYHTERPGFSIYYSYRKQWKHISRIEDIYAIVVEGDVVKFEMQNSPTGFAVQITNSAKLASFVSCITGYYRLMVKWTLDLCPNFPSLSLPFLLAQKCHGPIGGEFSYLKLQEAQNIPGSYVLRQCETMYNTYYIDIIRKGHQPETFKIIYEFKMWHLHQNETIKAFNNLQDLAKSIKCDSKQKFRLAPSEHDKCSNLLLCLPPNQPTAKKTLSQHSEFEMRHSKTQLLNPATDFRKYLKSQKKTDNGIITEMKADWILPEDKKLEVTLKILNKEEYLTDFMSLAEKWCTLFSPELIKMYGFTLSLPRTFVIESIKMGPLDEFLRNSKETLSINCLINASHSLARALHYLQERNFIHGRIRCATLQVIKFDSPHYLLVRLGDPGLCSTYTKDDIPWIPIEYTNTLEQAKLDFKAEVWAFATTMWEIFAHGRKPTLRDVIRSRRRLPQPSGCPPDIYNIILQGWEPKADKRLTPQAILVSLISARETLNNAANYASMNATQSIKSMNGSLSSRNTEDTTLSGGSTPSINVMDPESDDLYSDDDDDDLTFDMPPTIPVSALDPYISSAYDFADGGKLIVQGKVGSGNFGIVYKGQYEDMDDNVIEVAIKTLKSEPNDAEKDDFAREINIMKNLSHPNIVKIIKHMEEPTSIIMEYVKHSSFLTYLNSNAPMLTKEKLLRFAKDIASGMEYLVSCQIVHRDLAARNVLVDSDECIKISDFGLARTAGAKGYYRMQVNRDLPVKWYAPESLKYTKYSYQSDVWSYGVTLFEMFSRGQQPDLVPNVSLPYGDLLKRLEDGERLQKPQLCPQKVYDELLMECWQFVPNNRPDFTEILRKLNIFIVEFAERV